mmetsp:Transcript_4739/g.11572  ORF Transcript_4739/g.11572 Transcript_4739/m.11572 type:complete len:93 (+) Transcript_4739:65-343(+)
MRIFFLKGAFIVNAGDLIQRWTNDRWKSVLHRVMRVGEGGSEDRLSVVLFTGPKKNTVVDPRQLLEAGGAEARYPATTAGEHLQEKLRKISN